MQELQRIAEEQIDLSILKKTLQQPDIEPHLFRADEGDGEARLQWLEHRRTLGIGGSEIAAVANASKFQSAYELWQQKTGRVLGAAENEYMYWGRVHEPIIAEEYARRNNCLVTASDPNVGEVGKNDFLLYTNKRYQYAFATPDRFVVGTNTLNENARDVWGIEIKTAGIHDGWGAERRDLEGNLEPAEIKDVPLHYYYQVVWNMMILNVERWDLVVLISGNTYREYAFLRNRKTEEFLHKKAVEFWERCVQVDVHPPFTGTKGEDKALREEYNDPTSTYRASDKELDKLAEKYSDATTNSKYWEKKAARIKQELKDAIGQQKGIRGENWRATWNRFTRNTTRWKDVLQHICRDHDITIDPKVVDRYTLESDSERFDFKIDE